MLPTNTQTPDGLEPEVTSPPTSQKIVHKLIMPSLNHYYKTPHYPLQVETHSFEGISPLWPPLPGRAIKLFFSTSPKTLSPKINSVLGYRGRIQLQQEERFEDDLSFVQGCRTSIRLIVLPLPHKHALRSQPLNWPVTQFFNTNERMIKK